MIAPDNMLTMEDFKTSIRDYVGRPWREVEAINECARDGEYQAGAASQWLQVSAELAHLARIRGNFDADYLAQDLAHHLRLCALFDAYYEHTQKLPG